MARPATKALLRAAAAVAAAAALWAYAAFDPASPFFPRCAFKAVTGWDCPGCGSQRALHALLQGRVAEAVAYNALLPVLLPALALVAAAPWLRPRFPRLHRWLTSRPFALALLALIVAFTVARNVM